MKTNKSIPTSLPTNRRVAPLLALDEAGVGGDRERAAGPIVELAASRHAPPRFLALPGDAVRRVDVVDGVATGGASPDRGGIRRRPGPARSVA